MEYLTDRPLYGVTLWAVPRFRRQASGTVPVDQFAALCNQAATLRDAPPVEATVFESDMGKMPNVLSNEP